MAESVTAAAPVKKLVAFVNLRQGKLIVPDTSDEKGVKSITVAVGETFLVSEQLAAKLRGHRGLMEGDKMPTMPGVAELQARVAALEAENTKLKAAAPQDPPSDSNKGGRKSGAGA